MIVYHELSSIVSDLGIPVKTLYALSNNLSAHYRNVEIPKRSGGTRTLYIPDEALKRVQRAIAENLLVLEPVSQYATAYKPMSGILDNAKSHVGKNIILKLDIYRFFDSVQYSAVKDKAFPSDRYAERIRILLAMLCYYKDVLPQGAPTSPAISNIILYGFDNTVGEYCRKRNIDYTRYCDDMTFSGASVNAWEIVSFVESELERLGFVLNKRKTKVVDSSRRQTVTGIVVNEKPNVSDGYKKQIRQEVYFLGKFGVQSHLERIGSDQLPEKYLDSLLGRINYVLQVCPDDKNFLKYKSIVSKAIHNLK